MGAVTLRVESLDKMVAYYRDAIDPWGNQVSISSE
jgi:catechol-2,3-dioxygenase